MSLTTATDEALCDRLLALQDVYATATEKGFRAAKAEAAAIKAELSRRVAAR